MSYSNNDSGEMYSRDAMPLATRSIAFARSTGLSAPLIVTASTTPFALRLSTWSFISDCNGEITTVSACADFPAISAGN